MKIVCFGDSLTFGWIGYSYRKYLPKCYRVINKGINGDTTRHVYERLEKYFQKHYDQKDIFVLHVGANDILLPYLAGLSLLWKLQMSPRVKGMRCILSDAEFEEEYEKFFQLFEKYHCKAISIGMPIIQLSQFPNEITQKRNAIIEKLAKKYHTPFVDAYSIQMRAADDPYQQYSWKHKNILRITDAILMMVFPFAKDLFSKIRHLSLTVDGVHYNKRSAGKIGRAVSNLIRFYDPVKELDA